MTEADIIQKPGFYMISASAIKGLKWLVGLKLIYDVNNKNIISSHYFSKKFKTSTLQGHER